MTVKAPYGKPLPEMDAATAAFWQAAWEHRFVLYSCQNCGRSYFPATVCTACDDLFPPMSWQEASGEGEIFSWIVMHRVYHEGFRNDVPYNVAVVKLKEGPYFLTNIIDCDPRELRLGARVVVSFDDVTDEVTLPKFRLARSEA